MRTKISTILALIALMIMASCTTPKDIVYFQDVHSGSQIDVKYSAQIKIQPKDQLRIIVSTTDERLTNQFNLSMGSNSSTTMTGGKGIGYTVDSYGDIVFPVLNEVHVAGLTREQVANKIREELMARSLVKDPVVIVQFMNLSVAVLGEVKSPGRYEIDRDKITILDAIAEAGDLTINGMRENVMIIRNTDGKETVYEVNLLDAKSVYESPVYYLQQDDVVYVAPNDKARRGSTINGNTVVTYSFWMTLASFLLSIGLIIFR